SQHNKPLLALTLMALVALTGCGTGRRSPIATTATVTLTGTINTGGFAGRGASAVASNFQLMAVPTAGNPIQAALDGAGITGNFTLKLIPGRYILVLAPKGDSRQ